MPAHDPGPSDVVPQHIAVPTSHYSFDDLAEIYNQARVDYIVPMPMNGRRMAEYINQYDIDMAGSLVALDADDRLPNGVAMLGLRADRAWITRLGVIPERRRRRMGLFLMTHLLNVAHERRCRLAQLEVIKGNDPAQRLFEKLGFEVTRELLIIRRAPGVPDATGLPEAAAVETLDDDEAIHSLLNLRGPGASWVEETPSLLNTGQLRALRVSLSDGEQGWTVFQRSPFQLQHIVLNPEASPGMQRALLYHLHITYPMQDTKVENVPADDATWPAFQSLGYFEAFRRYEMILQF